MPATRTGHTCAAVRIGYSFVFVAAALDRKPGAAVRIRYPFALIGICNGGVSDRPAPRALHQEPGSRSNRLPAMHGVAFKGATIRSALPAELREIHHRTPNSPKFNSD
jgi:hypothetical protein